jgi:hypothetical protein
VDWLIAFIVGVVSGIVASVIVLLVDRRRAEAGLRQRFRALAGTYQHFNLANSPCPHGDSVATTELSYVGNATFDAATQTDYGNWHGQVKMDPDLPSQGAGTFTYDDPSRGSGTMQVVVMPGGGRVLVSAIALDFVGSPPSAYWWVRAVAGA